MFGSGVTTCVILGRDICAIVDHSCCLTSIQQLSVTAGIFMSGTQLKNNWFKADRYVPPKWTSHRETRYIHYNSSPFLNPRFTLALLTHLLGIHCRSNSFSPRLRPRKTLHHFLISPHRATRLNLPPSCLYSHRRHDSINLRLPHDPLGPMPTQ